MKIHRRIIERFLIFYMCSPLIGTMLVMLEPLIAIIFWVLFIGTSLKIKRRLSQAFKVRSFLIFVALIMLIFSFFGWFMVYAVENNLHNGGGVLVFLLPVILMMGLYGKFSVSYKQALRAFIEA